jgi:hypothetical protein
MHRKFPRQGGDECRVCELEGRKKTRTEVGVIYEMANTQQVSNCGLRIVVRYTYISKGVEQHSRSGPSADYDFGERVIGA